MTLLATTSDMARQHTTKRYNCISLSYQEYNIHNSLFQPQGHTTGIFENARRLSLYLAGMRCDLNSTVGGKTSRARCEVLIFRTVRVLSFREGLGDFRDFLGGYTPETKVIFSETVYA